MARRWKGDLSAADVTPEAIWHARRRFLTGAGSAVGTAALGGLAGLSPAGPLHAAGAAEPSDMALEPNSWEEITSYNNFYEFGTRKTDPAERAGMLTTEPWPVEIGGLVERPGTWDARELIAKMDIEERIYRLRCVEAWSMVVPWNGFELADLLKMVGVRPEARYVAFETLYRPEEMIGQNWPVLDWPYVEGLRLDEAMHPLTIMASGIYGKPLPNQNGAPLRLVVPWKYGFKSIKSVVRITLVEDQPPTSWNRAAPREYGFYANVNPEVDHPRWSQKYERVIGAGLFARKRPTLPFNGYEREVAHLYAGMDLTRFF